MQYVSIDYENREVLFKTRNTLYSGSFDAYNPEHLEKCIDYWVSLLKEHSTQKVSNDIFIDLIYKLTKTRCKLYKHINRDSEKAEAAEREIIREKEQARSTRIEIAKSKLENQDIYLGVGSGYSYFFDFAVLGTGEVTTKPGVHVSTFGHDSIIVFNRFTRSDGIDLRYFLLGDEKIEFYRDLYNTNIKNSSAKLIVHNSGKSYFDVTFINGEKITLAPNEETICKLEGERRNI